LTGPVLFQVGHDVRHGRFTGDDQLHNPLVSLVSQRQLSSLWLRTPRTGLGGSRGFQAPKLCKLDLENQ
jgi:hypothetical protein